LGTHLPSADVKRRWEGGCDRGTVGLVLRFGGVEVVACGHADGGVHAWRYGVVAASTRSEEVGQEFATILAAVVGQVLDARGIASWPSNQPPPHAHGSYQR